MILPIDNFVKSFSDTLEGVVGLKKEDGGFDFDLSNIFMIATALLSVIQKVPQFHQYIVEATATDINYLISKFVELFDVDGKPELEQSIEYTIGCVFYIYKSGLSWFDFIAMKKSFNDGGNSGESFDE